MFPVNDVPTIHVWWRHPVGRKVNGRERERGGGDEPAITQ